MKKLFYTLIMLLSGISLAQTPGGITYSDIAGNDRSWQDMQIGTVFEEVEIQGSRYMDEIYKMGTAFVNGKEIQLLMRYDAFNDQIELIDRNQKSFNLLRKKGIEAEFDGQLYKVIEYNDHGENKLGYANPLNDGPVVLLFKPHKVFVQAEKPENGYDDFDPPRFEDDHSYYIQRDDGAPEKIRLGKRPLLRYLKDEAPELRKFISENDLKLNTEKEAVQLIDFYNSIQDASDAVF